jgi:hypothetical protein
VKCERVDWYIVVCDRKNETHTYLCFYFGWAKRSVQDDSRAYNHVRSREFVIFLNISGRFCCVSHEMSLVQLTKDCASLSSHSRGRNDSKTENTKSRYGKERKSQIYAWWQILSTATEPSVDSTWQKRVRMTNSSHKKQHVTVDRSLLGVNTASRSTHALNIGF